MNIMEMLKAVEDGTMKECDKCHGYGSALDEKAERCTKCNGLGVVNKNDN